MFLKVETAEGNGDEVLRECVIEKALVKEAKSRGGMAVKFVSPGFDGVLTVSFCFLVGSVHLWN